MRDHTRFLAAGLLALFPACSIPGGMRSERIAYDDRIVFHASVRDTRDSITVLNLGPGPLEAFLGAEGVHTHRIEIPEGAREYVMLADLQTLEIRHPAGGGAEIEWTVRDRIRDRIRVEVDGPAATSTQSR